MHLDECGNPGKIAARLGKTAKRQASRFHDRGEASPVLILQCRITILRQGTYHRAAADKAHVEAASLFLREYHDLVGAFRHEAPRLPHLCGFKRQQHAQHAVEVTAVRHRVDVRTAEHDRQRVVAPRDPAEPVARRIGPDCHAQSAHPVADEILGSLLFLREAQPTRPAVGRLANARDRIQPPSQPLAGEPSHVRCLVIVGQQRVCQRCHGLPGHCNATMPMAIATALGSTTGGPSLARSAFS